MANPEQQISSHERDTKGLEQIAKKQLDKLGIQSREHAQKNLESRSAEKIHALEEAKKEALAAPEGGNAEKEESHHDSAPNVVGKQQRQQAYKQTMKHVQAELNPAQRTFSKFIHHPVVEKISDITGATIARPNAILSGSICAFLLVLGLYINARYMGYALSGFETIGAFIIGWIIGVLFDLLSMAIRSKR